MLTRLLRSLLPLLILLGLGIRPAGATHLLGGEMNYKYLDANGPTNAPFRYQITVLVYLNKEAGSNVPDGRPSVDISFYNKSQNGARVLTVTVPRASFVEITPPVANSCAAGSRPPRVTLARYVTTVNLPASFDGYYAVYTDSARNIDVSNLSNPGNTNMTLYVDMAAPLLPNTSPVFSDTAVAVICQGDTTLLLNNAYDADGDRLIYSFGTPYQGAAPNGSFTPPPPSVTYAPGFSLSQPFGAGGYAALNASTGLSRYFAPFAGKYVVAVDVKEYRTVNGREILVGTTRRDIQLVSRPCQPNQPPVFTPTSVAVREFTIEEGQTVSFNITASDPENQNLTLKANSVLLDGSGPFDASLNGNQGTVPAGSATGSASISGASPLTGTFRFVSRCGNARATPYDVVVTVNDNTCNSKTIAEVYRITVVRASAPRRILGDSVICDRGQAYTYQAVGSSAPTYRWRVQGGTLQGATTGSSVQVLWTTTGTGTLTVYGVSAQGCLTDSVSRSVDIRTLGTFAVSPDVSICPGASATLTASGGGPTYTWTGGGQTYTGASITVSPRQTTTYTVTTVQNTCTISRQVTVTILPQPTADTIQGSASVCPTVQGVAYSIRNPRAAVYQWRVTGGTIASGQGTPAITVNWGPATTTASVRAVYRSAAGCLADTAVFPVRVNPQLATPTPTGPLQVCLNEGPFTYQTTYTNGSVYTWQIVGGTQVSTTQATVQVNFTRAGRAKLVVTESSNPSGGVCRGVSDTLYVNVLPAPAANLAITGPSRVCASSGGTLSFALPGEATSTYTFTLNGATLPGTGNSRTLPTPAVSATPYTLTARETSAGGCLGPVYTKTFSVVAPLAISGPANYCPESRTGLAYAVASLPGGQYQWSISGGTIASGQGTNAVRVDIPAGTAAAVLSVTETTSASCAASFTIRPDNASVALTVASVDASDRSVTLALSVPNNAGNGNQVRVLRRPGGSTAAYTQVGTTPNTAASFTDNTADADAGAYQYRLDLVNACGTLLSSQEHTTIFTQALATEATDTRQAGTVQVTWTPYRGFAVQQYLVSRVADNGTAEVIGTVGGSVLTLALPSSPAGFNQCFRVQAVGTDGRTSSSNDACVTFENKLGFYNIITPNGDGKNDVLIIDNVQLYPSNTLSVYNRYGRQMYQTRNYRNNFGGEGCAPGMYYYLFKLDNGTTYKGWFEIAR